MDDAELRALLAAQARLIAELSDRLAPVRPTLALGELYKRHEAARKARPAWYSVRAMLLPFVERYADRDAGTLAVRDWTDYREGRAALAPSSRNTTLAYVKAMLGWAVEQGLLADRPPICKALNEKQRDHRETAPDESELQRLLAACTKPRERVIVLCACDSGMRRNEIRQLQWSWIDWDRRTLSLPNWACKGGRGGVVPATRRELAAIDNMPRDIRSPYVLRNARGEPYAKQMFTNWFRALALKAGIEAVPGETRVRLHDGRHAYATNAVARGVRIEVVSDVLRHASLEQTRAYVQRRPRDLEQARDDFERGIERDTTRR
jgi:integrase